MGAGESASGDLVRDLDRARGGDREALERLLVRIQHRLGRLTESRLGPRIKARLRRSDVLQNAYLEVIQAIDSFKGTTEEAFLAWVGGIVENNIRRLDRFFSAGKRRGPERTSEARSVARELDRPTPTPSTEIMRCEELALAGRALGNLTEDYREVILLCVVRKLSHREAAAELGRTEGATRMLLSRARAALTLEIERLEGGPTV